MPETRRCRLSSLSVVAVRGADARAFLQGQLTNDLLGLERHPGMLAAACSPQGRVLELLRLAAHDEEIRIVVDAVLAAPMTARLRRYVLRADVQIEAPVPGLEVAGLIDAAPDPSWHPAAIAAAGLDMLVASRRRLLLVGAADALEAALAAIAMAPEDDWWRTAIEDGEPRVETATSGSWLPQMLNLDLIAALSFSKGCYTGQEIVARTQHRGRIKRRMLRYRGPPGLALGPGQPLYCGEAAAAQVVAAVEDGSATELLAVVGLEYRGEFLGAAPGRADCVPGALPYAVPAAETAQSA